MKKSSAGSAQKKADAEESISSEEAYEAIKDTLQNAKEALFNGHYAKAEIFLSPAYFPRIWEGLLHHSMVKKNCPVTKLIIVHLIRSKILAKKDLALKVSKVDHEVQKEFSRRITDFVKSDEVDKQIAETKKVREVVITQLRFQAGVSLISPKEFE
jgi:hypothetical protein